MNQLDLDYQNLLRDILTNGTKKMDRTGTGTISVFGRTIRFKFENGNFPLLTTKKVHFKGIVTELLWFLRGETNIKYLVDRGCNIWVGDAYKAFKKERLKIHEKIVKEHPECNFQQWVETVSEKEFIEKIKNEEGFSEKWGDLGPIYGKQWRDWRFVAWDEEYRQVPNSVHNHHDQIATLIKDLRNNPDSRRLMVNAWNVGEIDQMTLPPCHFSFQCYTTELTIEERFKIWFDTKKPNRDVVDYFDTCDTESKIKMLDESNVPKRRLSLMWNQRSVDTFLGLSFNISSYSFLLILLAIECNMIPEELIGNLGDTHLYLNHIEQAKEQIGRKPFPLPTLLINSEIIKLIQERGLLYAIDNNLIKPDHFSLINYISHPPIHAQLSN
jgi:thymidylate synthase